MDPVILDTDVLSFIAKADTRAKLYLPELTGKRLCICFQSVAELHLWALVRRWGSTRIESLNKLLAQYVVLPYDSMMAKHWAEVNDHRRRIGRPIGCGDAWIAAAALRHDATLLSNNSRDFTEIPNLKFISHGR
jgi:predicted nucleic acid-binding protein